MGKELAFFEGKIIPVNSAKVGIMTHALHYGTAVFEGIRGNWNSNQNKMYVFRLKEHYERLIKGCKILKMDINIKFIRSYFKYTVSCNAQQTIFCFRWGNQLTVFQHK